MGGRSSQNESPKTSEGYGATSDTLVRVDLCDEAIRLAPPGRLMPGEPEVAGLLALPVTGGHRGRHR